MTSVGKVHLHEKKEEMFPGVPLEELGSCGEASYTWIQWNGGLCINTEVGRRGGAFSSFSFSSPFILIAAKYPKLKSERKYFLAKSKGFNLYLKFYLSFKSLCKSFHVHYRGLEKHMTKRKKLNLTWLRRNNYNSFSVPAFVFFSMHT